jgi:ParB family transcriptional regulator, chromosome partitioning protein
MDEQNEPTIEFPQTFEPPTDQTGDGLAAPRRRLGRGISSLLGGLNDGPVLANEAQPLDFTGGEFGLIAEGLISRNPYQPRKEFAEEALAEMVESITLHGVLQPLLVRPFEGGYQLIAGERRLLAARKAGLATVPCRVVDYDDKKVCEVAIIENVQRADLSDLEQAQSFQDYLQKFGGTIEELAARLGRNRSTVSNVLRLLELPDFVKIALSNGRISAGHARALLPLDEEADQVAMCRQIEAEKLSVRQTEEAVREKLHAADEGDTILFGGSTGKSKKGPASIGNHARDLQQQLRELLGCKVEIKLKGKDSGRLVIHFGSNAEFDRIVGFLKKAS